MASSAKLGHLPFETLEQIATHLDDTHRRSLYALSLTSKTCRAAALRSVFREIHLVVHGSGALQRDVDTLIKALSRTDSVRHVRHLGIKGCLLLDAETSDAIPSDDGISWSGQRETAIFCGGEPDLSVSSLNPLCREYEAPIQVYLDESMAWQPVVDLVANLPQLAKLVYDCRNQFPLGILDAVHKHHPRCKICHLTFRMRTLRWKPPDPHEMAIATSPCLYSVNVRYNRRDARGDDDWNLEAMLELVAGLAPNLKEVRMIRTYNTTSWRERMTRAVPQEAWRGLPGFMPGRRIGSLTSLSLQGTLDLKPDALRTWCKHTDFRSLRSLTLGGGLDYYQGISEESMGWIAQNCSFPRLTSLHIRLNRSVREPDKAKNVNNTIEFFKAFEPLQELYVSGSLEPAILGGILSKHGRTLRKFGLLPSEDDGSNHVRRIPIVFRTEHVVQIRTRCPALQDLAITVKRTESDVRKAAMYRSFGTMERLQTLFLVLDCSDWRVTRGCRSTDDPLYYEGDALFDEDDPSFDQDDRQLYVIVKEDAGFQTTDRTLNSRLRRGHVRDMFLNCAVDEALARSIWETICQGKRGKPLKSLKLYTTGGGSFGERDSYRFELRDIVDYLSRSWLIERDGRRGEDSITVEELTQRPGEDNDKSTADLAVKGYQGRNFRLEGAALDIFHRIWPRKEGSRDWRDDWASVPLYGTLPDESLSTGVETGKL